MPHLDSLSTITTDTGAYAPGDHDFSHYRVPGLCLAAAHNTLQVTHRSLAAQTYRDSITAVAPEAEIVPAGVVTVARACGARFTVTGTAPHDFPDLFDLALAEQNDSLAQAVVVRRLALASTAAARDTVLQETIAWYLAAEPARVTTAEAVAREVDTLEPQAVAWRVAAHRQLLAFATHASEWPRMQREATQLLTLSQLFPPTAVDQANSVRWEAYTALATVAVVTLPASLPTLAQHAQQALQHARPSGGHYRTVGDAPTDTVLTWLLPEALRGALITPTVGTGRRLPSLTATYWFPTRPSHWPPGTGDVSIIVAAASAEKAYTKATGWQTVIERDNCLDNDDQILAFWAQQCYGDLVRKVQQWTTQYGDRVAITVVVPTRGRALRSLLLPAAEADTIAWYFRDYLKLPVTVAVVTSAVRQLPPPSDHLLYTDTALAARAYWSGPDIGNETSRRGEYLLLTPAGQLLYAGGDSPLLDVVLARAMTARPAETTRPALRSSLAQP